MVQAQKELQEKKGNFFYNTETKYLTLQQGNKKQDMLFNDWKGVVSYFNKSKNLENLIESGFDRAFVYNVVNFVEKNEKKEASIRMNKGIKKEISYLQEKIEKQEIKKIKSIPKKEEPAYEIIAKNYTKNTFEWLNKEFEKGADLDSIQKYLKKNNKGEYYIDKEGIALYRGTSDVRYVKKDKPIRDLGVMPEIHIVGNVPKTTKKNATAKAQDLIEESRKELTLFEKLYGAGDLEFKIKIVGEEMAKRKVDKTKVVEKKEEPKKSIDIAQMKKEARENEKVKEERKRKGDEEVNPKKVEKKKKEEEIDLSEW